MVRVVGMLRIVTLACALVLALPGVLGGASRVLASGGDGGPNKVYPAPITQTPGVYLCDPGWSGVPNGGWVGTPPPNDTWPDPCPKPCDTNLTPGGVPSIEFIPSDTPVVPQPTAPMVPVDTMATVLPYHGLVTIDSFSFYDAGAISSAYVSGGGVQGYSDGDGDFSGFGYSPGTIQYVYGATITVPSQTVMAQVPVGSHEVIVMEWPTATWTPTPTSTPNPWPKCRWWNTISGYAGGSGVGAPTGGGATQPGGSNACDGFGIHWWILDFCVQGFDYYGRGMLQGMGQDVQNLADETMHILVSTPDLGAAVSSATGGSASLGNAVTTMRNTADDFVLVLIMLAVLESLLRSVGSENMFAPLGGFWRAFCVLGVAQIYNLTVGSTGSNWFSICNWLSGQVLGATGTSPITTVDNALKSLYEMTMYTPGELYLFLLLFIVIAAVLLVVLFGRLVTFFILTALFVVAPLAIVCLYWDKLTPIAKWWFGSFLAYSLLGFGYAVILASLQYVLTSTFTIDICNSVSGDQASSCNSWMGNPGANTSNSYLVLSGFAKCFIVLGGLGALLRAQRIMTGMASWVGSSGSAALAGMPNVMGAVVYGGARSAGGGMRAGLRPRGSGITGGDGDAQGYGPGQTGYGSGATYGPRSGMGLASGSLRSESLGGDGSGSSGITGGGATVSPLTGTGTAGASGGSGVPVSPLTGAGTAGMDGSAGGMFAAEETVVPMFGMAVADAETVGGTVGVVVSSDAEADAAMADEAPLWNDAPEGGQGDAVGGAAAGRAGADDAGAGIESGSSVDDAVGGSVDGVEGIGLGDGGDGEIPGAPVEVVVDGGDDAGGVVPVVESGAVEAESGPWGGGAGGAGLARQDAAVAGPMVRPGLSGSGADVPNFGPQVQDDLGFAATPEALQLAMDVRTGESLLAPRGEAEEGGAPPVPGAVGAVGGGGAAAAGAAAERRVERRRGRRRDVRVGDRRVQGDGSGAGAVGEGEGPAYGDGGLGAGADSIRGAAADGPALGARLVGGADLGAPALRRLEDRAGGASVPGGGRRSGRDRRVDESADSGDAGGPVVLGGSLASGAGVAWSERSALGTGASETPRVPDVSSAVEPLVGLEAWRESVSTEAVGAGGPAHGGELSERSSVEREGGEEDMVEDAEVDGDAAVAERPEEPVSEGGSVGGGAPASRLAPGPSRPGSVGGTPVERGGQAIDEASGTFASGMRELDNVDESALGSVRRNVLGPAEDGE